MSKPITLDALVIGAGAAGLMTAITAAQRGAKVVVIDHANKAGKKILMSGGGRCNFTNMYSGPENFISANPHFCKSALARYTPWDFIDWVNRHGIAYHEKKLGQLFCDHSSKDILNMLLAEAANAGVEIVLNTTLEKVEYDAGAYRLTAATEVWQAAALVVATGGLSIPKMGATGFGYQIARQFGLPLEPTRAGLVPFTLSGKPLDVIAELKGVAVDPIRVEAENGQQFEEAMLCTHRGISGPAMLQISSYWQEKQAIRINLLPQENAADWMHMQQNKHPKSELKTVLSHVLPKRFAEMLSQQLGNPRLADMNSEQCAAWAKQLNAWSIKPSGTEGYRTAEVTLGGVSTDALSSKTMQCRNQPGLYFVGEVMDVTGHLGGHNFQWAWSSGYAAGCAIGGEV